MRTQVIKELKNFDVIVSLNKDEIGKFINCEQIGTDRSFVSKYNFRQLDDAWNDISKKFTNDTTYYQCIDILKKYVKLF